MLEKLWDFLPAVAKPLQTLWMKYWLGMKFDEPMNGNVANQEFIELTGTYWHRGSQHYRVYSRLNDLCFPQRQVIFDEAQKKWKVRCHFNLEDNTPTTVFLAECSPEIEILFDYYFLVGERNAIQHGADQTKESWFGITISHKLSGLNIVSSTIVRKA